ncbi:MAG: hypothetical protein GY906_24680 [bacterium]|nr:hypothetical protein [bacterium]
MDPREGITPTNCPHCKHHLDAATNLQSEERPAPGDMTVCINCAAILRFDEKCMAVACDGIPDDMASQDRMFLEQAQKAVQRMIQKGKDLHSVKGGEKR